MSHSPVLYSVSSPSLAALGLLAGKFNDGDWASVGGEYFTYRAAPPLLPPIGGVSSIEGGCWVPYGDVVVQSTTREVVVPGSGTTSVVRLPLGAYVASNCADCSVDISTDGGSTWIAQQCGPDFTFYVSGKYNPPYGQPASVADVASGIDLAGIPPVGWLIRIRWIERTTPFAPRSIVPTKFTFSGGAWVRDDTSPWHASNSALTPNGIVLPPPPPGFHPELWRVTRRVGGFVRTAGPRDYIGGGRRLIPYFRGPQTNVADPNAIVMAGTSDVRTPAQRKLKYRVCYYNPTLRIRSAFAPGLVTYFGGRNGDRHNNESVAIRTIGTVYVDPS